MDFKYYEFSPNRLKSVFFHVPALHWIVVEDASKKSQMVSNFLESSGLTYTHLHQSTPQEWKLKDSVGSVQM